MSFILFLKIDYLINEKDCNIAQKRSSKLKLKIRKLKSKKKVKGEPFQRELFDNGFLVIFRYNARNLAEMPSALLQLRNTFQDIPNFQ